MFKRLFVIALVPNSAKYTVYLFEKDEKYVVPVEFSRHEAKLFLCPEGSEKIPNVYNTTKRVICGLGGKLVSALIYKYDCEIFYTYLNIIGNNKNLEFNVSLSDAINITKLFEAPLYIKSDVLASCGIKVSKQILRDALQNDY